LNILAPTLNINVPVSVPEANQKNLSHSAFVFSFKSLDDLNSSADFYNYFIFIAEFLYF
jgi:hypothetical protein